MTSAVDATLPQVPGTNTSQDDALSRIVVRCMDCETRDTGAAVEAKRRSASEAIVLSRMDQYTRALGLI